MNKGVHGDKYVVVGNLCVSFFIENFTTRYIDGVRIMAGQTGTTVDFHFRHRILAVLAIFAQIFFVNITEEFITSRIVIYRIFNIKRCSVVNEIIVCTNRFCFDVNGPVGDCNGSGYENETVVGGG